MVIFAAWIVFIPSEQKNVCKNNKDFCRVLMPSDDPKILESDQYQKSDVTPSIIYADLESYLSLKK